KVLLAWRRRPVAKREQLEAVGQPGSDLVRGQRPDPGGSQLDRQRHAVNGPADVRDRGQVPLVQRKPGTGCRCPLDEELDRLAARDDGGAALLASRGLMRGTGPY